MGELGDVVTIDIGAESLTGWDEYSIESDLLTPADGFDLSVPLQGTYQERRDLIARVRGAGLRCFVYVQRRRTDGSLTDRALQLTGIIDKIDASGGRDGSRLQITGRDNGALLVDADADPRLGVTAETTLLAMVEAVCDPYGITVITESVQNRLVMTGAATSRDAARNLRAQARAMGIPPSRMRRSLAQQRSLERTGRSRPLDDSIGADRTSRHAQRARRGRGGGMTGSDIERINLPDAKPGVGEKAWDFIDRHCKRFGVLPWFDARGRLILGAPDYDQEPLFRFTRRLRPESGEPNNIISGGQRETFAALASEVTVYGHTSGRDAARSRFHATVTNANMPVYRPIVIHDPTVRTEAEAERRAQREIARQQQEAYELEYEVHGHGQGELVYAIDTVADVLDEQCGVEGLFYVTTRSLLGSGKNGRTASVTMVPLHAIEV